MHAFGYSQPGKRRLRGMILILVAGLLSFAVLTVTIRPASTSVSGEPQVAFLPADSNEDVITIGVASATSGPVGTVGWRQVNAVQLAVAVVNDEGGIDINGTTYTINVLNVDSGCDAMQATAAATTLIDAGAVAVIGHTCSGASDSAQSLYAAAGIPMISASATAPFLTEGGYDTTFRTIARDDAPPEMLATQLIDEMGYQTAAIVELDGFFGNFANDVFSATFGSLGGTISSRNVLSTSADVTATLSSVMAENPDVIHVATTDAAFAGLVSRAAHQMGMTDVTIGWTAVSAGESVPTEYVEVAGIAAEGDIVAFSQLPTYLMPGYNGLDGVYSGAGFPNFGDEPQIWGAFAFDAAWIIIKAIDRADSIEPSAIRDEIAATVNYTGTVGLYKGFDDKGDSIPQWAWLTQYEEGSWRIISPRQVFLPLVW